MPSNLIRRNKPRTSFHVMWSTLAIAAALLSLLSLNSAICNANDANIQSFVRRRMASKNSYHSTRIVDNASSSTTATKRLTNNHHNNHHNNHNNNHNNTQDLLQNQNQNIIAKNNDESLINSFLNNNAGTVAVNTPSPTPQTGESGATNAPTSSPQTSLPTASQEEQGTENPTQTPTVKVTNEQTEVSTSPPTSSPSSLPMTEYPTINASHQPSTKPSTAPSQYIPFIDREKAYIAGEEEEVSKVIHDPTADVMAGLLAFFGLVGMLVTAQQLFDHPDGLCASCCRLSLTFASLLIRMCCIPCSVLCGFKYKGYTGSDPSNKAIFLQAEEYTDDLELT